MEINNFETIHCEQWFRFYFFIADSGRMRNNYGSGFNQMSMQGPGGSGMPFFGGSSSGGSRGGWYCSYQISKNKFKTTCLLFSLLVYHGSICQSFAMP
jgi:hypothetical protein